MVYYLDEMYAEVCAYLTSNKYFELPNYRVRIIFFNDKYPIVLILEISIQFYIDILFVNLYWDMFYCDWICPTF